MNTQRRFTIQAVLSAIFIILLSACQAGESPGKPTSGELQPFLDNPGLRAKLETDESLQVIALGDSITEGYCDRTSQCYWPAEFMTPTNSGDVAACSWSVNKYNPEIEGYRRFLKDKLTAEGIKMNYVGSVEVINGLAHEGHSAFTINDLDYCIKNAGWLDQVKPDIILLYTGGADAGSDNKPEIMIENLKVLLEDIYTKLPETTEVVIAYNLLAREGVKPGLEPSETELNTILGEFYAGIPAIVKQLQGDGKHVSLVDMEKVIQSIDEYDEGGYHPRAVAAERMAQAWLEKIMAILDRQVVMSASPTLQPMPVVTPFDVSSLPGEPLRIMPLGDGLIEGVCDRSSTCKWPEEELPYPRDEPNVASCSTNWNETNPGERGFREFLRGKMLTAGVNMRYVGSVQVVEDLAHEGHSMFGLTDLDYCIQNAKWLENAKPDMILLFAGNVDIFQGDSPEVALDKLQGLINNIYQKLPETTEVIIAQMYRSRDSTESDMAPYLAYYDAFPQLVEKFRSEGKHVSYVDFKETIKSPDDYAENGISVYPVVYERMAKIWFDKIMEILAERK